MFIYYVLVLLSIRSVTSLIGYDCGGHTWLLPSYLCLMWENATSTLNNLMSRMSTFNFFNSPSITMQKLYSVRWRFRELFIIVECSLTFPYCIMEERITFMKSVTCSVWLFFKKEQSLLAENRLQGIRPNRTTIHSITLGGRINNDGSCKGIQYSDPYGTWDDVVVQGTAKVTLKSSYVQFN